MNFRTFLESERSKLSHYLLIGNPISHSLSPLMHNTALAHNKIGGEYISVSVAASDITSLIAHCNQPAFLGANVTIPHKELLYEAVDALSEEAMEIGAVNTIVKEQGKLVGYNTDAYGFIEPIRSYVDDLSGERVIIFGSGGATKAIVYALSAIGVQEIILVSRRPENFDDHYDNRVSRCSYDEWQSFAEDATMIVNATPLGMTPNTEASPVKDNEVDLLEGKICYDVVYNPRITKFLRQTEEAGGTPIEGIDMLIHQGDKSFNLWTGFNFPIDIIRSKINEVLPA